MLMTKTLNEAFVYCWTDHKLSKLYVGLHKGNPTDGYVCSSKSMLEEYLLRPHDFSRQIIATGSMEHIRRLENKILQSANAALSDDYYNRHNGGLKFYPDAEARKKIAASNRGKKRSQSARNRISAGKKGRERKPLTEETKLKMSEGQKLRGGNGPDNHSHESKLKMSIAGKGRKQSREWIDKRIAARLNTLANRRGTINA
jgi:NUMOD3 motif